MLSVGRGSIIMTSSIAGSAGIPNLVPYAASKGGINQLVRTMGVEWAQRGFRVNAVAPGYIENIMADVKFDSDDPYQKRVVTFTLKVSFKFIFVFFPLRNSPWLSES